ncbi:MAG TPA: CheY-P-specific phosphatase CheC [Firmicutes bacterium]|jgi:chemotaxis protein CheC|nr:MAG: hypothetical protein AA931_02890 [Peptococcaceae bacterium 1109]HHT72542.1 CheY-P-specific phosphatase CheC [Bacillota bacterium]
MTSRKVDFLRELGTIGVGHATIALSDMLQGKLLRLEVPDVRILRFGELAEFIGGLDQTVAGVFIQISGDVSGYMAFILPVECAAVLVKLLVGNGRSGEVFDALGRSAIEELGNIMITSYLNALSALTGLVMKPSIPGLAIDMAGAVWQSILAGALVDDEVTLIRTEFSAEGVAIDGNIILLPAEDEFKKIARVLGLEEM